MITAQIEQRLTEALQPESIEIIDHSAAHAGHAGAQSGGGHYQLTIVAQAFDGKSLVARHKMVYQALGEMMKHQIHALSIHALSPSENTQGN